MMLSILFSVLVSVAYPQQIQTVPKTCSDLLPDLSEYIYFFEQVGDLWATQNSTKAQKLYDVLSVRKLYQEVSQNYVNPIDNMIKDQICECFTKNNSEPFDASSKIVRTCLDKDINKLLKKVKKEFLDLKAKVKKDENSIKLTNEQKQKIESLKERSLTRMENELGTGPKKIKKSSGPIKPEAEARIIKAD